MPTADGILTRPSQHRPGKQAFTLVELLVIIAIIAVLVSLLSPTFRRTVQLAEAHLCGRNLGQIGQASLNYASQNQTMFPSSRYWVRPGGGTTWNVSPQHLYDGQIWDFVGAEEVYVCPTFARVCGHDKPWRSFSMNYNFGHYTFSDLSSTGPWPRETMYRFQDVSSPVKLMMYADENPWGQAPISRTGINDGFLLTWSQADAIGSYHLPPDQSIDTGCSNCVFVDGHVELVDPWEGEDSLESWRLTQNSLAQ